MEEEKTMIDFVVPIEDKMQGIIKVVGVGGGGCNAVRNMNDEQIPGVTFAVCNTDSKSLAPSPVPVKILLGEGLGKTRGRFSLIHFLQQPTQAEALTSARSFIYYKR